MKDRLIAAQIESLGVNGLGLARGSNAIGFRAIPLLPMPEAGRFDNKLPIATLKELGPYDPEGKYHQVVFQVPVSQEALHRFLRLELINANSMLVPDFKPGEAATVRLEWLFDGQAAHARISSDRPLDLMVMMNGCLKPAAVAAQSTASAVLEQEGWKVHASFSGKPRGTASDTNVERLEVQLRGLPIRDADERPAVTGHRFQLAPDQPVYVTLAESAAPADPQATDAALEAGRADLQRRAMRSAGSAADCADAIQRLIGFASCYNPNTQHRTVPVNRDWVGPNSIGIEAMWDHVFDPYLASLHDPELGKDALLHILGIIDENGMDGMATPTQRNLIIPVVYSKMVRFIGDPAFAARTFPTAMAFIRFYFGDRGDGHPWRDGNDDGLIELGSCLRPGERPLGRIIQNAFDETGYDDSPMYSDGFSHEWRGLLAKGVAYDFTRGTLNLTMVGQNSLYVASCRAVAVVADWVGAQEEARWLRSEAERVAARIQERLYDPEVGYFRNRFFDGAFSPVKTMDLFYPLMAGLGDASVQARLREMLLDPGQFWGENVIPTVSRDDPAYCDEPFREAYWKGNYWRGNIWPPTNYITYLSIRSAGWEDVAAEFSAKSRRLFMDDWLPRHHANENYPPEGRTERTQVFCGFGGRDPHYIWAGLLPLIALEELFSVEDTEAGIRFGSLDSRSWGSWEGFQFHGRRGGVRCDADGLVLDIPGVVRARADRPLAIRGFVRDGGRVRFRYGVETETKLELAWEDRGVSLTLKPGRSIDVACAISGGRGITARSQDDEQTAGEWRT